MDYDERSKGLPDSQLTRPLNRAAFLKTAGSAGSTGGARP